MLVPITPCKDHKFTTPPERLSYLYTDETIWGILFQSS
jgi:hypothetical protein